MGVTKEALTAEELAKIENVVARYEKDTDEHRIFYSLRCTGMHSCCLYRPEANVRVIDGFVRWSRPMKGKERGRPGVWAENRGMILHPRLDFDIGAFYRTNLKSRRKRGAWKVYIHGLIRRLGVEAGIPGVSPNSLRHTVMMNLHHELGIPKKDVAEMMGCSVRTIDKHYDRLGERTTAEIMKKKSW
jgi:hypothetical protein